ncbi:hypothetical protein ES708_14807 [subsurface metagenome]
MLVRSGNCNHCGLCCLREGGLMVENPCIELGEDRCKFYVDELNNQKYGHCLIFGRGRKPVKVVKDRYGNKITPEQIVWFNDNCPDYPTIEDMAAGHKLLPECSFRFEAV